MTNLLTVGYSWATDDPTQGDIVSFITDRLHNCDNMIDVSLHSTNGLSGLVSTKDEQLSASIT